VVIAEFVVPLNNLEPVPTLPLNINDPYSALPLNLPLFLISAVLGTRESTGKGFPKLL